MSKLINFEGAVYEVCDDECCLLRSFIGDHDHFKVPSAVFTEEGKRYRVSAIIQYSMIGSDNTISFDESSEITGVPVSFTGRCKSVFYLPPRIKRVLSSLSNQNFPKIVSERDCQRFVSTAGSRVIMNHFPLDIIYQHSLKQRYIIRETVQFVGRYSFIRNQSIVSVVFPSSVENIDAYAFYGCCNLRFIRFKKYSKLRVIGNHSFRSTAVESVDIPANVEEIDNYAFDECNNLRSIRFSEDSKLKVIGYSSFQSTAVESVNVPTSVEKIKNCAFYDCQSLRSVKYLGDSMKISIGVDTFAKCPNLLY